MQYTIALKHAQQHMFHMAKEYMVKEQGPIFQRLLALLFLLVVTVLHSMEGIKLMMDYWEVGV